MDWRWLSSAARGVLRVGDAPSKARASRAVASAWQSGAPEAVDIGLEAPLQLRPARPERPHLLPPRAMPKRRNAGTAASRLALLHALAHIELNAIDLAWDLIARFGSDTLPGDFFDDWVRVADDEARHFLMLDDRLRALGSGYGELPAHDGLWEAAIDTSHDILARLAIAPMVLEARGLDVTPGMIARLRAAGDEESAALLETIYDDEIGHVAAGARWFKHLCEVLEFESESHFQSLVRRHFSTALKPPFNDKARESAGLLPSFYQPLAKFEFQSVKTSPSAPGVGRRSGAIDRERDGASLQHRGWSATADVGREKLCAN